MLVDVLLRFLGQDPNSLTQEADKWPLALALIFVYGVPVVLMLLFFSPYIYMWFRKIRFSIKNILIAFVVGFSLVGVGVFAAYWFILLLGGFAVDSLYGGTI